MRIGPITALVVALGVASVALPLLLALFCDCGGKDQLLPSPAVPECPAPPERSQACGVDDYMTGLPLFLCRFADAGTMECVDQSREVRCMWSCRRDQGSGN